MAILILSCMSAICQDIDYRDGTVYEKKVDYLSLRVWKGGLVSNRGTV